MNGDARAIERRAGARGHVRTGALESRCTFSSGDYYDPAWMGFGVLRVLNEDALAPGAAVAAQRCANMDVLVYVLGGGLVVEGTPGPAGHHVLAAGDACWIGAGHGLEFTLRNASASAPARWLQAWIQPDRLNAPPASAVLARDQAGRMGSDAAPGHWRVIAGAGGEGGALPLRQQAALRELHLADGASVDLALHPSRRTWLQVVHGGIDVDGNALATGDALGWSDTAGMRRIAARGGTGALLLLFELPP